MRHIGFALLLTAAISLSLSAQTQPAPKPPQTARQALIEMFLGKAPDAFAKHLPRVTSQALIRKGETPETSLVQKISTIGRQLSLQEHLETFDEGPTLLVSEQNEGKQKIRTEVTVEHDSFTGENDEIELSVHVYRDGQPEFLPVIPRLTFSLMQENEIWKLSDVKLTAILPLTDQEYLQGVRKKEDESIERMVSARVSMIAGAETRYALKHQDRGFTCSLSELFGKADFADATASPANFYDPSFASSDSMGYHFSLSGCDGTPAVKFQIAAAPTENDSGMKAFCADQSGTLRSDASGKAAACLSRGQVLNKVDAPNPVVD